MADQVLTEQRGVYVRDSPPPRSADDCNIAINAVFFLAAVAQSMMLFPI